MASMNGWTERLEKIEAILIPGQRGRETALPPHYTQRLATIVGLRTTTGRFLPVSHEGESNETYVDKVELLGKTRAEFIARKQKATERRAHMRLFRQLAEAETNLSWREAFTGWFNGQECEIPDNLCTLCWNDSLFGSLRTRVGATFARTRYFDTYSLEDAELCIARTGSEEGMAVGNTVREDLSQGRGEASLHYYEYVKAGTHFPFITVIESPTSLDLAGLLQAITLADLHGHGKYSANNGKFSTEIWAVSIGVPRFSVLDMLTWADEAGVDSLREHFIGNSERPVFEDPVSTDALTFWGEETASLVEPLREEFKKYVDQLSQ